MLNAIAKAASGAVTGVRLVTAGARAERRLQSFKYKLSRRLYPARVKENEIVMKKSTFGAMVVGLAAATGALAAGAIYLYRREKELDEYEKLLFSDEFNDSVPAEDKAETEEETEPEVEVEISLQPADQEEKPVEAEAEEVSAEDAPAQEKPKD